MVDGGEQSSSRSDAWAKTAQLERKPRQGVGPCMGCVGRLTHGTEWAGRVWPTGEARGADGRSADAFPGIRLRAGSG